MKTLVAILSLSLAANSWASTSIKPLLKADASKSIIGEVALGQDKGNGATFGAEPNKNFAWFTGKAAVKYCVDIAPDFPVNRDQILIQTSQALNQWISLFRTSDYHYYMVTGPGGPLDLNYKFLDHCDGSEDLKFYFGKSTPEVEAALKQFDVPVISVAQRTHFDVKKLWSKGFVWLAPQGSIALDPMEVSEVHTTVFPNWTKEYQLRAILLHEIGHVFGSDHMSGTIMDANIGYEILAGDCHEFGPFCGLGSDYLLHINHQRMVLPPADANYDFPGKLGYHSNEGANISTSWIRTTPQEVFQLLMGAPTQNEITAVFHYRPDEKTSQLDVDAGWPHQTFDIQFENDDVAFDNDHGPGNGISIPHPGSALGLPYTLSPLDNDWGQVKMAQLTTATGRQLQLQILINSTNVHYSISNNGPVTINYLDSDMTWKTLYQANLVYQDF